MKYPLSMFYSQYRYLREVVSLQSFWYSKYLQLPGCHYKTRLLISQFPGCQRALKNCDQHMWIRWQSKLCQYKGNVVTQILLGIVYWSYRYPVRGSAITPPSLQSPLKGQQSPSLTTSRSSPVLSITPIFQIFYFHWWNKKSLLSASTQQMKQFNCFIGNFSSPLCLLFFKNIYHQQTLSVWFIWLYS